MVGRSQCPRTIIIGFQNVTITNFSAGVAKFESAQYSDVGLLNLDVQDSNYGDSHIVIEAPAINIGRFISDHFKQSVAEHGQFFTTCPTGTMCAYSGQKDEATNTTGIITYSTNPIWEITAFNQQDGITENYSIDDHMKLSAAGITVTPPMQDEVALGVDNTSNLSLTANMNPVLTLVKQTLVWAKPSN
jgi:MSHA biogenesis protein MshQ